MCFVLLPLAEETTPNSYKHTLFHKFLLELLTIATWNVGPIIDDNCNVKKAMSSRLEILLLKYKSHRSYLAAEKIVSVQEPTIIQVW